MQLHALCKAAAMQKFLPSTKMLLVMRMLTFFLLAGCLHAFAKSNAQVSISEKQAPLEKVLKSIKQQSGFTLFYDELLVQKRGKPVSVNVQNASVNQALQVVFTNQELTYEVIGTAILVKEKEQKQEAVKEAAAPGIPVVHGRITNEKGEPISGVNVTIKGAKAFGLTNENGEFTLYNVANDATLVFSAVTVETFEVKLNGKGELAVQLKTKVSVLDDIVIIGYGTTTRRTTTGAQEGISAKDIEKQPVTNVLQVLSGRLPGVFVTQTNGLPGAGITVQVRGVNSLAKSNFPLYIIDDVPYLSEPINTATKSGQVLPSAEGNTSPMNSINPSDIENIEILKDADATSIYGSRGANGVVLITTKKGKAGKTKLAVTASTGASVVTHFVDLLTTEQYLAIRKKGIANSGTAATATTAPDLVTWDQNAYTDFQRTMLGNTARTYDATANISGGSNKTNFYLSGTYHKETNVYPGAQGYQRGAANFNLNHLSDNQRFNLTLSAVYTADKNNISTTELASYAYSLPPNTPLYNADGSLYWFTGVNNPMGYLNQTNDNRTTNLITSLGLKYNLLKGLDIKATIGYGKVDMTQTTIRPLSSLNSTFGFTSGTASYAYNFTNNYIAEPQVTYKRQIWKGTLDLLAGGTWQYKTSKMPYYVSASGFLSDEFLTNISAATTRSVSSASQDYKYTSVFGRATYNIQNRYIANFTFRRDGSSRFGEYNRFGNFGSAGLAWIFSDERFIKNNLRWLSFGKLRSSYGVAGSDDIGNYQYLDSYSSSTYVYNATAGLLPSRIANNSFKWETTKKLEVALELGFLKDRLSIGISYYRNQSDNQLLSFPLSAQTGFISYQSNLPATVQNSGVEFSLTSNNIKAKHLSWTTTLNITKNNNKLLSFPGIEKTSYYTTYVVGNPISAYNLYQYTGIDATTGLPSFTDFDKSGTVNSGLAVIGRGDRYYAGTGYPQYYGGLTNSLSYKGLNLDFTFQFVKQQGRGLLAASFYPPGYMYNAAADVMYNYLALGSQDNLVTATTGTTAGRAAYLAYSNYTGSDASIEDASFIRMKNVSLSYNVPASVLSKIKAQNIRLFVQAQNLFTITGYKGFDPESQGVATPPLRTLVAGFQYSF